MWVNDDQISVYSIFFFLQINFNEYELFKNILFLHIIIIFLC